MQPAVPQKIRDAAHRVVAPVFGLDVDEGVVKVEENSSDHLASLSQG
jgi:hypothetical protein